MIGRHTVCFYTPVRKVKTRVTRIVVLICFCAHAHVRVIFTLTHTHTRSLSRWSNRAGAAQRRRDWHRPQTDHLGLDNDLKEVRYDLVLSPSLCSLVPCARSLSCPFRSARVVSIHLSAFSERHKSFPVFTFNIMKKPPWTILSDFSTNLAIDGL